MRRVAQAGGVGHNEAHRDRLLSGVLTITRSNSFAIVSWPDTGTAFRLEINNNLSLTNGWATAPQTRSTNAGIISVTAPASTGNNFYRLKNP